jgi:RHS repeat-associated protein
MAKPNAFRFSTKYQDDETDLPYYGYRYYNASTGRWLSRDPIEAEGGLNEYDSFGNDPVDLIDQLGLKMLFITVARDKTLPGAPGAYWSRKVKERTELMRHYLQNILQRCVECSGRTPPTVMANFASGGVLQAPAVGHWTIGDKKDEALMEADWNLMGSGGSTVRVFWTFEAIERTGQGSQGDANGVSYENKGIILSFRNSGRDRELLAHEVGHYAGYIGNAPGGHSSDPNNVMYKTHVENGLNDPDTEYCDKVFSLAR